MIGILAVFISRFFLEFTSPHELTKLFFEKTDKYGDTLWTRTFSGGPFYNSDIAYAVVQTIDS